MRTVCGWGRRAQMLVGGSGKGAGSVARVAAVRPLAGGRAPLITDRLGLQTRSGVKLDQVDGTTCGSAVLVALAAWADPAETRRLDGDPGGGAVSVAGTGAGSGAAGVTVGFGARYDSRQRQVHRESTRLWPPALGTSPWGMVAWLRRHAPGAGPYQVRLVDDTSAADVDATLAAVDARSPPGGRCRCSSGRSCPATTAWSSPVTAPTRGGSTSPRAARSGRCRWTWSAAGRSGGSWRFDRLHAVLLPA